MKSKIITDDIRVTCISMLQASSETITGTLTCGIGALASSAYLRNLQDEAYTAIIARWTSPQEAFHHAFDAEDIPLIVAIYKEMLRYYPIVPYIPGRKAVRDIELKSGAIIPRGTTLYGNTEQANHGMGHHSSYTAVSAGR